MKNFLKLLRNRDASENLLNFKLLNVDYHKSSENDDDIKEKREEKQRKFINQFALLDHTRFMTTLC